MNRWVVTLVLIAVLVPVFAASIRNRPTQPPHKPPPSARRPD